MKFVKLIHDNILKNGIEKPPVKIYGFMCNIYAGWQDNKKLRYFP